MNINMDLDVAWCLTCSKRTRDAHSTYCSDACRTADQGAASSSTSKPFTSPLPAGMMSSPPKASSRRESAGGSPTKSPLARPPLRALPTAPGSIPAAGALAGIAIDHEVDGSDPVIPVATGTKRDRRAFSLTDPPSSDSLTFTRRHSRQSTVLSPANKRSIMAALTPISHPVTDKRLARLKNKEQGSATSTGVSTPFGNESVFCSTSDSSDDGIEHIEYKSAPVPVSATVPSISHPTLPSVAQPSTLPKLASDQFSTLRSQLSSGRANSLHSREASHSPVAAMIASSASSRSREDIMSWARAVAPRDVGECVEDDEDRGRPRTRRLTSISSSRHNEPLQESDEEGEAEEDVTGSGLGTTPKGRIGAALSGLGMTSYGVGSIVKALTAVTTSPSKGAKSDTRSVHGTDSPAPPLTALPSAASVSRVAVFAHTNPSLPLEEAAGQFHPGTTPTISTLSISEVVDFSVQGTHDQADIVTDDGGMSATSSNFVRRVSIAGKKPSRPTPYPSAMSNSAVHTPPAESLPQRNPLPRPLVSTASAIWSVTSYFARFAPFSIQSAIAPFAPVDVSVNRTPAKSGVTTPAKVAPCAVAIVQPRSQPDSPLQDAQELVRSLPMNIIPPPCSTDEDWERNRQRAHEKAQMVQQRSSRSRRRDSPEGNPEREGRRGRGSLRDVHRERRRSVSRDSSPGEWTYRKALVSPEPAVGSTNQDPDADADVSADEGNEEPRGRRGRATSIRRKFAQAHLGALQGAELAQEQVSTGTETERGRGRSRSVRPGARA